MHLGNSVICPVTGVPMIAAMGIAALWAFKKAKKDFTKDKIVLTVMLTAFVFGLQMLNFAIPSTGSSGHIVGAVLLSFLLGPYVAFLAISSILLVQCLFFADGGVLALGCNIFNMGFLACFVAYPLVSKFSKNKIVSTFFASVLALQLGSAAVVIEGGISGSITDVVMFAGLMQGIHLAIGLVEGIISAGIVMLADKMSLSNKFAYIMGGLALCFAGIISNYASSKPDGLEWSLINMSDKFVEQTQGQIYAISEVIQTKTAVFASIPSLYANIFGLIILMSFVYLIFRSCCLCDNQVNQG